MSNAKSLCVVGYVLAVLFGCLLILTTTALVQERSTDKLRLTVASEDMLAAVGKIQVACRCYVDAVPIGEEDTADYWLLSFNRKFDA